MSSIKKAVGLVLFAACVTSYAESIPLGEKTLTTGQWTVYRKMEGMSDKVTCTGVNVQGPNIQLSSRGFYIALRGGIDSVELRFDEKPSRKMRVPTDMEKKVRAIILDEEEFQDAINSDRLRFESLRTLGGFNTGDINLDGIKAARDHIQAGCPASTPQNTVQEVKSTPQEVKQEFCVQPMRDKLRAAGVTAKQIKQVCDKA